MGVLECHQISHCSFSFMMARPHRRITISLPPSKLIEAAGLSNRMNFRMSWMIMRIEVIIAFIAALVTIAVVTRRFRICYIFYKH